MPSMTVEVVSPEEVLYSGETTMVITRTIGGGEIAFQPGHCAFLGALQECHTPITLPKTGSDSTGWLVQGGLWLLMFGALGMVLAHRRRHGDLLIRPDSTS